MAAESEGGVILPGEKDETEIVARVTFNELSTGKQTIVEAPRIHVLLLIAEGRRQAIAAIAKKLAAIEKAYGSTTNKKGKQLPKHERLARARAGIRQVSQYGKAMLSEIIDLPVAKFEEYDNGREGLVVPTGIVKPGDPSP